MRGYVYLGPNDLPRAIGFCDAALAALDMSRCVTGDEARDCVSAGWGRYEAGGLRELALWVGVPFGQRPATVGTGTMVALRARSRAQVDAFHAAALARGGHCEGLPGMRAHYAPDFYAA